MQIKAKATPELGDWVNVPDNSLLNAKFVDIEPHEFMWFNAETGKDELVKKWNWKFEVTEPGEFQGRIIRGQTPTTFTNHENCKAMNWMVAIAGREFAAEEGLDTDDLSQSPCRIITEQSPSKKDDRIFDNVVDVLPAPTSVTAASVF